MVSARKFLGKLSARQAVRLVMGKPGKMSTGLQPRIGRFVRLDATRRAITEAPQPKIARQALQKWLGQIHEKWRKSKTPLQLLRLQHQRELLRLLHLSGQRQLTSFELAAMLGFQHGLKKENMLPYLRALLQIERKHPEYKTWQGTISNILSAFYSGLPEQIEHGLLAEKKILDSKEIAEKIGKKWNVRNTSSINAALQLLNQMGLIEKQPGHKRTEKATHLSTWSHKQHGELEIRHPNAELEVMEALHKKIMRTGIDHLITSEISKPKNKSGSTSETRYNNKTIIDSAKKLAKFELVRIKTGEKATRSYGAGKTKFHEFYLTQKGQKLMQEFHRRGRKSFPSLRRYLLGIKE